jgi:tetratricopeptide (TPR) repeat protein
MKTIKIFLASSEELNNERLEITDLVTRLNQTFKWRGIELELKKWEYLDSSMGDESKQEEYNRVLRDCDICLVLFWRKLGRNTVKELEVAYQCHKQKVKPEQIYVFFKNPDADDVSSELKEFIKSYESRYGGHFFCKFQTVDTLKLEFVLQFELYQKALFDDTSIEVRNEHVYVDNEMVADLNNIPFAANNEGFKKRQVRLKELRELIQQKQQDLEKKKKAVEIVKEQQSKLPDEPGLQMLVDMAQKAVVETVDTLQKLHDEKNKLADEFEHEQQNLLNTARRITEQRGQVISQRMARAIEAFENGDAQRADVILDEGEKDFEDARKDFRITKKVGVQALEEQIQRASYKMSNDSIPIDERIEKAIEIYEGADAFAQEINYEQKKYIEFLWKYSEFLHEYDRYNKAIEVYHRLIKMCEDFYGKEHPNTVNSYSNIGNAYKYLGKYDKAFEYLQKAISIKEKDLGKEATPTTRLLGAIFDVVDPHDARLCVDLGYLYYKYNDYNKSLEYYIKALESYKLYRGEEHPNTVQLYDNIGDTYLDSGDYSLALEYYKKALVIKQKANGEEHPDIADSYNRIGLVFEDRLEYDIALDNYQKSLVIFEKTLGEKNQETVRVNRNIGNVYRKLKEYHKALDHHQKALAIEEKVGGKESLFMHVLCRETGDIYYEIKDYGNALDYYQKAIAIGELVRGKDHSVMHQLYCNIAVVYDNLANYDKAIEYYLKAIDINKEVLERNTLICVQIHIINRHFNDTEYQKKVLNIFDKVYDEKNPYKPILCSILGHIDHDSGKYKRALEWFKKAGEFGNKRALYNVGVMYFNAQGIDRDYFKAIEWFSKAAEQGYEKSFYQLAYTYYHIGKPEEALHWAEKAVKAFPTVPSHIDFLATVYQNLGRLEEAIEQFELCLKLKKEQGDTEESIQETETEIAQLKEFMKG